MVRAFERMLSEGHLSKYETPQESVNAKNDVEGKSHQLWQTSLSWICQSEHVVYFGSSFSRAAPSCRSQVRTAGCPGCQLSIVHKPTVHTPYNGRPTSGIALPYTCPLQPK